MSHRPTALITGASSGIGHELARVFAQRGYDLVLVARGREQLLYVAGQLREQADVTVHVIVKDLARPAAAEELVAELRGSSLAIDVLVNNAGVGAYGPFADTPLPAMIELMHVNMATLTQLTRLLLPDMIQRKSGKVLNVASTAAFQPGPLMAVYYASKAYVLSLSEALADEVAGSGVTVTALCPGPTRSAFQQRAGVQHTRLMSGRIMDAASVARIGYDGLMQGRPVVIPGLRNRLLVLAVRLVPRSVVTRAVRHMQEMRGRA